MSQTNQTPRAILLTIPPEIRLEIYELVLAEFDIYCPCKSFYPSLLRVCRLVRWESVEIFGKRCSAIFAKQEAEVDKLEKEYEHALHSEFGNYVSLSHARDILEMLKRNHRGARRLAEGERQKLREEGFRV